MHSGKEVTGTRSCAHLQRLARTRSSSTTTGTAHASPPASCAQRAPRQTACVGAWSASSRYCPLRRPAQKPVPNSRRPGLSSTKPSAHRLRRSRHPPRILRLSCSSCSRLQSAHSGLLWSRLLINSVLSRLRLLFNITAKLFIRMFVIFLKVESVKSGMCSVAHHMVAYKLFGNSQAASCTN